MSKKKKKEKYDPEKTLDFETMSPIKGEEATNFAEFQEWLIPILRDRDHVTEGQHEALAKLRRALHGEETAKGDKVAGIVDDVRENTDFRKNWQEREARFKWLVLGLGPVVVALLSLGIKITLALFGIKI